MYMPMSPRILTHVDKCDKILPRAGGSPKNRVVIIKEDLKGFNSIIGTENFIFISSAAY